MTFKGLLRTNPDQRGQAIRIAQTGEKPCPWGPFPSNVILMSLDPLPPVKLCCSTDLRFIDLIQVVGAELLKHMNFSLEDAEQLWLAIQEGIANAMRHGNQLDPARPIQVTFTPTRESLAIRIEDSGSGFDPEQVPNPNLPENLLKPFGRGVYFMRQVMDSVTVEPSELGSALLLVKRRQPQEGTEEDD